MKIVRLLLSIGLLIAIQGAALQGEVVIRRNGTKVGHPVIGADFQLTPKTDTARTKTRGFRATVDLGEALHNGTFKLIAWEECTLSVRIPSLIDPRESAKEMTVDGHSGIWWQCDTDRRLQWYERADGGLEWEICLDAPPQSNLFSYPCQISNLIFCHQGELTPEEIAEGAIRPDSVVGSYAVYHATGRGDRIIVNQTDTIVEQYGTGKAFHIYRPKAHDANGQTSWCELKIDSAITITVPEPFLKRATYPVTIDPTFGYTNVGGTSTIPGTARANINDAHTRFAGSGETITGFSVYASSSSGTQLLGLAAYTMDNGTPKLPVNRLAAPATISITGGTPIWYNTATQSQGLTSGTRYCAALGDGSSNVNIFYDSYGATARSNNLNSTLPTTWISGGTGTVVFSMYATYTVSSATVLTRRRRNPVVTSIIEEEGSNFNEAIQIGRTGHPDSAVVHSVACQ